MDIEKVPVQLGVNRDIANCLLVVCLKSCCNFLVVVFTQEPLDKKTHEIRERIKLSVETDVPICQLDTIADIGIFVLADQRIQRGRGAVNSL